MQVILEGLSGGECFRDTPATRAGAVSGSCSVLSTGGAGVRLLYVVARRLTLRNLVLSGGAPDDTASGGGCVYVQGDLEATNVVFQNCSSRQARGGVPLFCRRGGAGAQKWRRDTRTHALQRCFLRLLVAPAN